MASDEQKNSKLKNILSIIGFILLLIVGIWSAVQVISFLPHLFSGSGVTTKSDTTQVLKLNGRDIALRITPDSAYSGDEVTIDWARKGNNEGVVSFSYACTEGFHFEVDGSAVPCNAPYTMAPETSSLTITPVSKKESVDAPLAITYTNASNESVRASATLAVVNTNPTAITPSTDTTVSETTAKTATIQTNANGPVEPSTSTTRTARTYVAPSTQYVQVPRTSLPYGVADIALQSIRVGTVTPYGAFEEKSTVSISERGAAKFIVRNDGTKETGPWYFSAHVPSQGGYAFNSQVQPSIMPGASAEILVTFDQLTAGGHTLIIQVDPYNYIPESNEYNNTLTQTMYVLNF